jgi:RND superfamily putative drug exporter
VRTLAKWCFTHRIFVVGAWVAAVIAVNAVHTAVGSSYSDNFRLPHTQSFEATDLLKRNTPEVSGDTDRLVIGVEHGKVTDPGVRIRAERLFKAVLHDPHVTEIASPYAPGGANQIAPSGRVAFAVVTFDQTASKISSHDAKQFVRTISQASGHGIEFAAGGQIAENGRNSTEAASLAIGFVAAAFVLFAVFGTFLAMLLPLLTAGLSLGMAIATIGLLSHVMDMATFSSELAALIGLGVGVDYALFVVTRYRQGRLRGLPSERAAVEAIDTSGRAVLFAGIIVAIAMLGMFALGVSFLYGVAVAAALAVLFTVLAALTLLPALLNLFGSGVLRRRDRRALRDARLRTSDESASWARWARVMGRHPGLWAAAACAVLVVLAVPFFSMRLGTADQGSDPIGTSTRTAYDLLATGFGPGYNGPLQLVAEVRTSAQRAVFLRAAAAVDHTAGVVGSTTPAFIPGVGGFAPVGIVMVYPRGAPDAKSTTDLLNEVRDHVIPAVTNGTGVTVLVGGSTAAFNDFSRVLSRKLPLFVGIVVLLSVLLLMLVFRSLVIPLTAAAMNLLSAGAAFGVVTAVFQNGLGASLIGIDKTGPIESFLPVLMFPILFGLSMDYEVFLVTRIFEEWHRRGDTREAVSHGLAATGRTITAAAAIMVLVFGAFVLGGERVIALFGVGLGGAVLIDAVVVRSVAVPATMLVLGRRNWWLPRWLERRMPRLNVEGSATPVPDAGPMAVPAALQP